MGSIVLVALIQHVFILCAVFWLLTWGAERLSAKRAHRAKSQFYECGFKSLSDLNLQVNLSFSLVCAFLVLYDVEFTFLFPLLVNYHLVDGAAVLAFVTFLFFILAALAYDLGHSALTTTV
jgi:NADH:ubiquinone oxidoreductase subunit 3 (subunit A)